MPVDGKSSFFHVVEHRIISGLKGLSEIGDLPEQSEEVRAEHNYLVYVGLLMSVGGIVWGSICFDHGLYVPAIIPYGYTLLTGVNFVFLYYSKNFRASRFIQVFLSLLLPALFQWVLGGFIPSGAVILWSFIALAGSLTFQDIRSGINWLIAFIALIIISGIIDSKLDFVAIDVGPNIITLFFVLNIVCVMTIVFFLLLFLLKTRDEAKSKLAELSSVLKQMFGRYMSTDVMNSLMENPSDLELGGRRKKETIMMTDLRGFTALSENLEP